MSTSPDDRLVNVLSHWLARHADATTCGRRWARSDDVRAERRTSARRSRSSVHELSDGTRDGDLEMVVRETLEALALGG